MNDCARSDLKAIYDRRFSALSDYRRGVWAILARDFFQPLIPENAAVLDLGCGWGEFVNQIRARSRFGMDMNRSSLDHLDRGVVFLHQDCSEPWSLEDNSLDVIFTSNHLEHLSDKDRLRTALIEAFRCLKSGGRIICVGPNIKHIPGAYWDFWDHFVPLTELSLKEGLELAGFRVERCVGRFLPYTMTTGFRWPLWTVSVYLKLPLLWRWHGRQFLLIAVKP